MTSISDKVTRFTVLGKPMPQGSMRGFLVQGKVRLTADNAKMKPYRQEVSQMAALEFAGQIHEKHTPIVLTLDFYFAKPDSCKKREWPTVKPDLDKLVRLVKDALTGIAYEDDSQVVRCVAEKLYGLPERTEIQVRGL